MPFDGLPIRQTGLARQAIYILQRINRRNNVLIAKKTTARD